MPGEAPDFAGRGGGRQDIREHGRNRRPGRQHSNQLQVGWKRFHGRYTETAQHRRLSSTNVDDALRDRRSPGGRHSLLQRLLRRPRWPHYSGNKLWFYGAFRDLREQTNSDRFFGIIPVGWHLRTLDDTPALPTAEGNNAMVKLRFKRQPSTRLSDFSREIRSTIMRSGRREQRRTRARRISLKFPVRRNSSGRGSSVAASWSTCWSVKRATARYTPTERMSR